MPPPPEPRSASSAPSPRAQGEVFEGDFDPGEFGIEIEYQNHRGEHKTFYGDARTLRRRGRHVSLRVSPTGRRIALRLDRVGNANAVERALARYPDPGPIERQILSYHEIYGTTSPRHRDVRAQYPNWDRSLL